MEIPFKSPEWKSFLASSQFTNDELEYYFKQAQQFLNPKDQNPIQKALLTAVFGQDNLDQIKTYLSLAIQKGKPQILVDLFFPDCLCYPERRLDGSVPLDGAFKMNANQANQWIILLSAQFNPISLKLLNYYAYKIWQFRYEPIIVKYLVSNTKQSLVNNQRLKLIAKYN